MKICLLITLMMVNVHVFAQEFNYSLARVSYVQSELEDGTDGTGIEYQLAYDYKGLVLSLNVVTLDYKTNNLTVSRDTHVGGLGTYIKIKPSFDIFGDVLFGVYNSETESTKLAERDVMIFKLGTRFSFDDLNEGSFYIARYDFSENQIAPDSGGIVENMVGFRAVLFGSRKKSIGFNIGVELYDSYSHMSTGLTMQF